MNLRTLATILFTIVLLLIVVYLVASPPPHRTLAAGTQSPAICEKIWGGEITDTSSRYNASIIRCVDPAHPSLVCYVVTGGTGVGIDCNQ